MAKKAKKKKKPVGRPTKYKKSFCKKLIDWFDIEPWETVDIPHYHPNGKKHWVDKKRFPARMPTLRGFAKSIGVHVSNVYEWLKKHEEFRDAFTCAKEIRKEWLIDLGLSGLTPPLAYKFTAINVTDMIDKKEHEVDVGENLAAFLRGLA